MPGSILENTIDPPLPAPKAHLANAPLLQPRRDTLKDGRSKVSLYPITGGAASLPPGLVSYLHAEFSAEIERGCTYPMEQAMTYEKFRDYWFGTFAVVALKENEDETKEIGLRERDWGEVCLGTFYIKPNYPGKFFVLGSLNTELMVIGRCSHVCNAGFLTCTAARGQGAGTVMGRTYLDYAPKLVSSLCLSIFQN